MATASAAQGLVTDLYQLTMLQAYLEHGMRAPATFELFTRRLPPQRNFLIAAGLDAALDYLEQLRFEAADIDYLESLGQFTPDFLDYLRGFRFSGSVDALPEGTPFFGNEPLLTVHGSLPEAQIVETRLLNLVQLPTAVATKAARVVAAADGRAVIDFGLRHAHGADASLAASRAAYIGGVQATSNVAAGQAHGMPVAGTMAHSFVQAHDSEREAFRHFMATFPTAALLVDTYDVEAGIATVIELARATAGGGVAPAAVRLDSGDLAAHARRTRRQLDAAGLTQVQIIASGNLDEREIARLVAGGAPIDSFGVGAALAVSEDAPCLDVVYKLVAYDGKGRMKLAAEKSTLPDPKQVGSSTAPAPRTTLSGLPTRTPSGQALLEPVMRSGTRLSAGRRSLDQIRANAVRSLAMLPPRVRSLEPATPPYQVEISPALGEAAARTRRRLEQR